MYLHNGGNIRLTKKLRRKHNGGLSIFNKFSSISTPSSFKMFGRTTNRVSPDETDKTDKPLTKKEKALNKETRAAKTAAKAKARAAKTAAKEAEKKAAADYKAAEAKKAAAAKAAKAEAKAARVPGTPAGKALAKKIFEDRTEAAQAHVSLKKELAKKKAEEEAQKALERIQTRPGNIVKAPQKELTFKDFMAQVEKTSANTQTLLDEYNDEHTKSREEVDDEQRAAMNNYDRMLSAMLDPIPPITAEEEAELDKWTEEAEAAAAEAAAEAAAAAAAEAAAAAAAAEKDGGKKSRRSRKYRKSRKYRRSKRHRKYY